MPGHAATVNRTDCGELRAHPFFMRFFYGFWRPKRSIFGLDFAGQVEAVGAQALAFKPGDRVFGMCPSRSNGAQAEYVAVPESAVSGMPAGTRFDEAVVCEGALSAHAILTKRPLISSWTRSEKLHFSGGSSFRSRGVSVGSPAS
jgi:NADPH:quinone reductase-like Zn-dependent oxidoreductase